MPKRKYTRMGEKPVAYQCTNLKCKWEGLDSDKINLPKSSIESVDVCPKCGNEAFYGLLDLPGKKSSIETISAKAEFLFELKCKQDWVNKVPRILPEKTRGSESRIWLDKNGNVFECGLDFMIAEDQATYPCKVYRLQNVASAHNLHKDPLQY